MSYELLGILLTVVFQGLYVAFEEKLTSIEKKQDKHNSLIERTYCIERDVSVLKEKLKVEEHRIEDLEEFTK
ncbi:MAG: hemolysin XhlA family protein [Candidatus Gastranaerophilales bacterium]|nr:hemolysin XhlA family protein [Candidatus Gastranaerophilales bacterium]